MVELLVGGNLCEGAPSYLAEKAKSFANAAPPEEQAKLIELNFARADVVLMGLGAVPGHTIRS